VEINKRNEKLKLTEGVLAMQNFYNLSSLQLQKREGDIIELRMEKEAVASLRFHFELINRIHKAHQQ